MNARVSAALHAVVAMVMLMAAHSAMADKKSPKPSPPPRVARWRS